MTSPNGSGQRLGTKEELRVLCGVSVGTFNEALRLVQARGVLTVRTGRVGGLFASQFPDRQLQFSVRLQF